MKKQILILSTLALNLALSQNAHAQSGWTATSPTGDLYTNGNTDNVGIGTNTPVDKLTVNGGLSFEATTLYDRSIRGRTANNNLEIYSNSATSDGSTAYLCSNGNPYTPGLIHLMSGGGSSSTENAFMVTQYGTGDIHLAIRKDGLAGIGRQLTVGTFTPESGDVLTLNGGLSFSTTSSYDRSIRGRTANHNLEIYSNSSTSDGSTAYLSSNGNPYTPGLINLMSGGGSSSVDNAFTVTQSGTSATHLAIRKDGQVIIGNVSPVSTSDYKLYVETGILTAKLKVAIPGSAQWSDYVFADNYDLKSLEDVETFIKANKHLPDVPSAENVVKNGVDVGKMDATLLQKIEELTLYVIQQQKEINELKNKLNK